MDAHGTTHRHEAGQRLHGRDWLATVEAHHGHADTAFGQHLTDRTRALVGDVLEDRPRTGGRR